MFGNFNLVVFSDSVEYSVDPSGWYESPSSKVHTLTTLLSSNFDPVTPDDGVSQTHLRFVCALVRVLSTFQTGQRSDRCVNERNL